MINSEECLRQFLALWPDFEPVLDASREHWRHGELPFGVAISGFCNYTEFLIRRNDERLPELFLLIEKFMTDGDEEVSTAIATMFLENLINRTSSGLDPKAFVHLLGKESRDYCRAWDKFTGVRTPGLWGYEV